MKLSFTIVGGFDKTSLHITPINGYSLAQWSFTEINLARRRTHFVFLTYGRESGPYDFWIILENVRGFSMRVEIASFMQVNEKAPDPNVSPSLEISVATHYAHGLSPTLALLSRLILIQANTIIPTHYDNCDC